MWTAGSDKNFIFIYNRSSTLVLRKKVHVEENDWSVKGIDLISEPLLLLLLDTGEAEKMLQPHEAEILPFTTQQKTNTAGSVKPCWHA